MKRMILLLGSACMVSGAELLIPISVDPSQSSLRLELCVQGLSLECNSQTRPLSGTVAISLDCNPTLREPILQDFQLHPTSDYNFSLFGGGLTADVAGLIVNHADPFVQTSFVSMVGDGFAFTNVPASLGGVASYDTSSLICLFLGDTPCSGTLNLADQAVNTFETLPIQQLNVSSNQLQFAGTFNIDTPIDPANPGLGRLTGDAVVVGSGPIVPCLSIERTATNLVVRWARQIDGFRLFQAEDITAPVSWEPVPTAPVDEGATWGVPLTNAVGTTFYRLSSE